MTYRSIAFLSEPGAEKTNLLQNLYCALFLCLYSFISALPRFEIIQEKI